MIQVKIINKIKFPEIKLQSTLEEIAKNIIIPDMEMRIDAGASITGGRLPPNSDETLKRKAKKGHGDKPLIDTGILRSSFYYEPKGKNKVIISVEDIRKEAGIGLQYGLQTRRYNFFGISKAAYDGAMQYARIKVQEEIDARK